jgi:hypothetical protein
MAPGVEEHSIPERKSARALAVQLRTLDGRRRFEGNGDGRCAATDPFSGGVRSAGNLALLSGPMLYELEHAVILGQSLDEPAPRGVALRGGGQSGWRLLMPGRVPERALGLVAAALPSMAENLTLANDFVKLTELGFGLPVLRLGGGSKMIETVPQVRCGLLPELELSFGAPQVARNIETRHEPPCQKVPISRVSDATRPKCFVALPK